MAYLLRPEMVNCLTPIMDTICNDNLVKLDVTYYVKTNHIVIEYYICTGFADCEPVTDEISEEDTKAYASAIRAAIDIYNKSDLATVKSCIKYEFIVKCKKHPDFMNPDRVAMSCYIIHYK